MRPNYKLLAKEDGSNVTVDVTQQYSSHILSMEITQSSSTDNDTLKITFDNDGLGTPPRGTAYSISIGYGDDLVDMGTYILDEYSLRGDKSSGHTLEIVCNGKALESTLSDVNDRSYYFKNLQEIAADVTKDSGLPLEIDPAVTSSRYYYEAQVNQSDQAFLTALADRHDATFTIKNGVIYIRKKSTKTGLNGSMMNAITIDGKSDLLSYSFTFTPQTLYTRAFCPYRTGYGEVTAVVGTGDSIRTTRLDTIYDSKTKAIEAGKAFISNQQRQGKNFEFEIIGNPYVYSQSVVTIVNSIPEINADWVIEEVTHTLTKSGAFTTRCSTDNKDVEESTAIEEPEDDGINEPDD